MIKKILRTTTFLTIICILCFLIKLSDTLVSVNNKTYASAGQTIKYESDNKSSTQLSVEMYRLYNPNSGEHFYTASADERETLISVGWKYEGVGWIAPATSNTPVYRLYNPNAGEHHYTMNKEERDNLITMGWKDEGIGWYSDDAKTVALYRQYNPNAKTGSHNYTTSKSENDWLVSIGWKGEGVGWYGLSQESTTEAPATTEHQHTWESVGHTETVYVRSDTGGQVKITDCVGVGGQLCIITGYTGGVKCNVCNIKFNSADEFVDHRWNVHDGEANSSTWQEPIYVSVTQKSIYVEDYQQCSTCGAIK
ncbi:MAG: hypothetical protein IJV15_12850 [Lachnospiraceae bacterium]|nr:hypothetical protein [Lachnospiraceae bacterium]